MHSIVQRPMVVGGSVVPRPMMYVALTYDHRLIDGREAVYFLRRIKDVVEDPQRLLLDIWWQKDSEKTEEITSLLIFVSFTDLLSEKKKTELLFRVLGWESLGVLSLFILYTVWTKCYNFDLNNVIDFYWDFHFHRDFFCQLPVSLDQVIIKLKYIFFKKHICVSSIWKKRTLYMIMYVAHNNLFISACNIERLWLHAFDL